MAEKIVAAVPAGGLEPAFVRKLKNKGFINKDKPIILVGDFWKPLVKLIADYESGAGLCPYQVETPEQAAELLKTNLQAGKL